MERLHTAPSIGCRSSLDKVVRCIVLFGVTNGVCVVGKKEIVFTAAARRALIAWLRLVRIAEPVQLALLQRYGVTFSELRALRILRDLGRVPISHYADALDISRSTATGLLDRFEQRGLATREASQTDRRVILITLTALGRQVLEDQAFFEESDVGQRIASLPVTRQRQLVEIAEALTDEPVRDPAESTPIASGQEVFS